MLIRVIWSKSVEVYERERVTLVVPLPNGITLAPRSVLKDPEMRYVPELAVRALVFHRILALGVNPLFASSTTVTVLLEVSYVTVRKYPASSSI